MEEKELNAWGKIHFVCTCNDEDDTFDLVKKGGLIYYKCKNPKCKNMFSTDVHLKTMDALKKYRKEHKGNPNGFVRYFKENGFNYKTKYIKTKKITNNYKTYIIEVTKLT